MDGFVDWLIRLLGALVPYAWLGFAIWVIKKFSSELSELLKRLKRANFPGGSVELNDQLKELQDATAEAQKSTEAAAAAANQSHEPEEVLKEIEEEERLDREVALEAAHSPKAALVTVTSNIQKEVRELASSLGQLDLARLPMRRAIDELNRRHTLPRGLYDSVSKFVDVRNAIVHGTDIPSDAIIRAVELGLEIIKAIRAVPYATYEIHHPGVDVFVDEECQVKRPDVRGVILKVTGPPPDQVSYRIYPTKRKDYVNGMRVTFAWDHKTTWRPSWYKDPDSNECKKAWDSSAEFVGRDRDQLPITAPSP